MLGTGSRIKQRFRDIRHAGVLPIQQDIPDLFPDGSSAGFPGMHHFKAPAVQGIGKPFNLGSLAAAVQSFHRQESAPLRLRVRTQNVQDFRRRMRDLFRAGFQQFLFAAVAVGDPQGMNPGRFSAFHIKAAVADHPDLAVIFRQGLPDQVFLFRPGVCRADNRGKETVKAKVLQDFSCRIGRFAGHDAQFGSLFPESPEHRPHAGIHPVFIHADSGVAGTVNPLCLLRLFLGHAQEGPEGIQKRRPDKLAQGRCIRFRKAHLLHRVFRAVPDALF